MWSIAEAWINQGNNRVRVVLKKIVGGIVEASEVLRFQRAQGQNLTQFKNMVKNEAKARRDALNELEEVENDILAQVQSP